MSRIFDEIRREAALQCSIDVAQKLIKQGKLTLEEIAHCTKLPLEKVQALAAEGDGGAA